MKKNDEIVTYKGNDLPTITMIGVYMVQKLGSPTITELQQQMLDKLNVRVHKKTLERAMEGAKKRSFVTIKQMEMADGNRANGYMMKNLMWKAPPEYAHVGSLLPKLFATEEGQVIKAEFDKSETAENGEKKSKSKNHVRDFHAFEVKAITLDPLLGSQINTPYLNHIRERYPREIIAAENNGEKSEAEFNMVFLMDSITGDFVIPPDVLRAWFRTNIVRFTEMAEARAAYIAFSPLVIKRQPVFQYTLPVNNARHGASAPQSYEALPSRQELVFRFLAPTYGFLTPEELKKAFTLAGLRPRHGLSPARGTRFGRFLTYEFKDLGPVNKEKLPPDMAAAVPEEIMQQYGGLVKGLFS